MVIDILQPDSKNLFWEISNIGGHFHVSCVDKRLMKRGSGFHSDRAVAKKKAFVELNERYLVSQLAQDPEVRPLWALDADSSASGFAAGYDRQRTLLRALLEATERWTLSKWVDDHFAIPEVADHRPTAAQREIHSFFASASLFHINLPLLVQAELVNAHVAVFLGWTGSGVFAGYGTNLSKDEAIDHAHIEAYRNFVIFKNQPARKEFPYNRITYFANNKFEAQKIIETAECKAWSAPAIRFLKAEQFGEIWLARAIMDGWRPWQLGSETRFLY